MRRAARSCSNEPVVCRWKREGCILERESYWDLSHERRAVEREPIKRPSGR